jgi:hypothetical protein
VPGLDGADASDASIATETIDKGSASRRYFPGVDFLLLAISCTPQATASAPRTIAAALPYGRFWPETCNPRPDSIKLPQDRAFLDIGHG